MLCLDYGYRLATSPSELTRPQISFLVAALNHRLEVVAAARETEPGTTKIIFTEDMEEE